MATSTTFYKVDSWKNVRDWKDVRGYEGLYQVNAQGLIRRSDGLILKPTKNYDGYLRVNLRKDGKTRQKCLHRLVAQAFIPNPHNLPEVNHLNGNREDCRAVNLEWCSHSANQTHRRQVLGSSNSTEALTVLCVETGQTYKSINEAAKLTGSRYGGVRACCYGVQRKTNGLHFMLKPKE